ncbi:Phenylalanyl-tRNA synthetase alpha chain, mitochondrial [Hyphomicrobiales bacterium]|nr:Phenylalanyl-tRNA synthetase alpha chain, mitochondrial [Hyphomicrobiales bacterium]CAH1700927.1 Phenylalanyl-tRNA synthetase alpha chain, mitochondrial [Hyphomicrobiales bacterium]CAI0344802.1 conserved exported hypothetical protein [Hyphomicrobiales bacterium]
MLTTRVIAAAFGAAALLGAAMSAAPASAAPISAGTALGSTAQTGLVQQVWHRGHPHHGWGRPPARRCWTETRRFWNGHRWVVRQHRICR